MADQEQQHDIHAVLDAALDDLDDENDCNDVETTPSHEQSKLPSTANGEAAAPAVMMGPERPPPTPETDDDIAAAEKLLADMMQELMGSAQGGGNNGDALSSEEALLGKVLQEMQSSMGSPPPPTTTGSSSFNTPSKNSTTNSKSTATTSQTPATSTGTRTPGSTATTVDDTISNLLDDMTKHSKLDESDRQSAAEESPEKSVLKNLMQDMGGGDFDTDAVIDSMMEQLVSKDLMYEPMKQVTDKFPEWLETNLDSLSDEEYGKRTKQYQCFKKLVRTYEEDPSNTTKLMDLMQDVQEYGQPPTDIIKEIAPGLEMDENGMPRLDASGMPADGECVVM